jgi:LysM repeat protein
LVVTSLTRPESEQPPNASDRSVHPTGMAADLRRPVSLKCRRWLEGVLMDLEKNHIVEATREQHPAHYHVAIFPDPYKRWIEGRTSSVLFAGTSLKPKPTPTGKALTRYQVRSGDSLWNIAKKHGTTVAMLRAKNDLPSNAIHAGQVIEVPATH